MAQTCGCSSGDSRWSLKGMTALVTGGTKGIGLVLPVFMSLGLDYTFLYINVCINSAGMQLWRNWLD